MFFSTELVPALSCNSPSIEVNGVICTVFELEREAVVRPALERDVVCAGCDRHGPRLAALTDTFLSPVVWLGALALTLARQFGFGG